MILENYGTLKKKMKAENKKVRAQQAVGVLCHTPTTTTPHPPWKTFIWIPSWKRLHLAGSKKLELKVKISWLSCCFVLRAINLGRVELDRAVNVYKSVQRTWCFDLSIEQLVRARILPGYSVTHCYKREFRKSRKVLYLTWKLTTTNILSKAALILEGKEKMLNWNFSSANAC